MPGVQADMAGRGEAVSTMSGRVGGRMGIVKWKSSKKR